MTAIDFANALVSDVREIYGSDEFIPLHAPRFGDREKFLVEEAIESTFVSSVGESVIEFENALAAYTGAQHAVAVSSGTAALHVTLVAIGVKPGDEVITTPLTFVATCNAISYCGASPVFVDVDKDTLGLSPESFGNFLDEFSEIRDDGHCWNKFSGRIIKACLPIHNLGHPARIKEIASLCDDYNILLVEDGAESLGTLFEGQHACRFGLAGAISFNGNKIITTGGGGAVLTDSEDLAKRVKHLTTTAKKQHPYLFLHDEVGFNYRLPNLNAALGLAQIERLDEFVTLKRALADKYRERSDRWGEVSFFSEPRGAQSNYWLNALLVPDRYFRDEALNRTNLLRVMTRPMWTPLHTLPMYKYCQQYQVNNSLDLEERLINLPSSVVDLN